MVGDKLQKKITVTVTGDSLHFHRDRNFWFDTTVILPASNDPKRLHATIKEGPRSQGASLGKVVRAAFTIEDEALTLAAIGDEAEETPKSFEAAQTRYELRKVQPQTKSSQPPKPEPDSFKREERPEQPGKYTQPPKPEPNNFRFEARP